MSELGPESRALLDRAREGLTPDPAALRRIRAKVAATTAAGAGAAGAASTAGGAGGAGASGVALAVKVGIVALVAAGTTAIVVTRKTAPPAAPKEAPTATLVATTSPTELPGAARAGARGTAPTITAIEPETPGTAGATAAEASGPDHAANDHSANENDHSASENDRSASVTAPSTIGTPVPAPHSHGHAKHAAASGTTSRPAAASAAPSRTDGAARTNGAARTDGTRDSTAANSAGGDSTASLSREVELLDVAMKALRKGDNDTALAAVRKHAAETNGHGQLAEDAAAIEVEALCRLGAPGSAAKLDAFDARWPESAQRSRLTTACHR